MEIGILTDTSGSHLLLLSRLVRNHVDFPLTGGLWEGTQNILSQVHLAEETPLTEQANPECRFSLLEDTSFLPFLFTELDASLSSILHSIIHV